VSDKPRVGFLGTGWIGRNRMEAMLATGLVEAAAIADPSHEMREQAAARRRMRRWSTTLTNC
jgi:predicted dehydrogenase